MGEETKPNPNPGRSASVRCVSFLVAILSIFFFFPETSTSTSIPGFNEVSQSQKWRRHSSRRREGEETATNRAYRIRTHTQGEKKHPPPPSSMPLNAAFCFFNVRKPSFIFVPCIMAQRWYHQRGASLTKWERQIDCSIWRQGLLSGDLIGSH